MSRPAGFSDSDSDEDFILGELALIGNREGKNLAGYHGNESKENNQNVWFDPDTNLSIDQNYKLNSTYNDEREVYLSLGPEEGKDKSSLPRQATPLPFGHIRMAVIKGNLPIVKSLIQKGVDVNQSIKSGWTLLMVAASSGQDHIIKYLLENGANPNLNKAFFTSLMAAAASERAEDKLVSCVEQLIKYDADIETAEAHGMTALMFAAKSGKTRILEILLRAGADVHKCDFNGLTALCWAASAGQKETVKILLKFSADPKQIAMGQNVIEAAWASGNKGIASLLEKHCEGTLENSDWFQLNDLEQNGTIYDPKEEETHRFREVENILATNGVESAIPIFREHKISLTDFMELSEKDLVCMGIEQFGVRFHIMNTIKSLNVEEWKKSSLTEIVSQECVTLGDVISVVRNMDDHIRCMSASFRFLRKSIETYPHLFTIERKSDKALHLTDTCFSYLQNVNGLKAEIEDLRNFLNKKCTNPEYDRPDIIGPKSKEGNWKRHSLMSFGAVATLSLLIYFFKPKLISKLID